MGASLYRPLVLCLLLMSALAGFAAAGNPSYPAAVEQLGTTGSSTISGTDNAAPTGSGLAAPPKPEGAALARTEFEAMLAKHLENPYSLLTLATEIRKNDAEEGLRAHERLVTAYPRSAVVQAALADALYRTGKIEDSQLVLHRALQQQPDLPEGRLLRGKLLAANGPEGLKGALREWRLAIEGAPGSPTASEAARLIHLHEGR